MDSKSLNTKNAEFIGAMIGDGCLSLIHNRYEGGIRKKALLTGHLQHDYSYYTETIMPIIKEEFGIQGYLQKRPNYNCVYFHMGNAVFDFLKELGFPIGKKKNLRIPPAILSNHKLAIACIRGIFNTDGTIYSRYSKKYQNHRRLYDYLVIQIKLNSKETITQIKLVLDKAGIASNRIIEVHGQYVFRITKQDAVDAFMALVKPSNQYHVQRYISRCKKTTGPEGFEPSTLRSLSGNG